MLHVLLLEGQGNLTLRNKIASDVRSVSLYIGQKLKSAGLDTLIKMEYVFDALLGDDSR